MNGIERILSRIEADARSEIDAILASAREEAANTEEAFRREAEELRASLLEKAEKAAAQREERLVSAARMEGRKALLATRQDLVDDAYLAAQARLCLLPHDEAIDVLAELLVRVSATGREEVIFSPADRERIGEAAVEKANAAGKDLILSEETRPLRGGFILKEGNVEINCAFETLTRLEKGRSAAAVAKILFQ
ncbi:MAG: V-type ATP synthase subunit E [Oscillibacter sp.]|nr:V-type ATP synthase subunit E [Oscillibacter sp.]